MNAEVQVSLDKFALRWYQSGVLNAIEDGESRRVLYIAPRRAGKDILGWNLAIRQCIKRVCLVFYVLPTYSQARKCIFDAIAIDGTKFLDYVPPMLVESINKQEMKIRFRNGSILQCIGGDTYDTSLVGTNPYAVILSEYALMPPDIFSFIRPILAANGGWCLIVSTPRGKNHLWHLWKIAQELPDWKVFYQKTSEIHHISYEVMEQEKAQMDEGLYLQEYECFPSNTGILTPLGVREIQDIKLGDLVYSCAGRVRKVLSTMSKEYEGELIKIKSMGTSDDILCTPEHPIKIYDRTHQSYTWVQASDVKKDDFVVFPKHSTGKSFPIISYDLCMILAWFITEGSGGNNFVQFSVGNNDESDRVTGYLDKLNIEYSVFIRSGFQIIVYSTFLLDFLKTNCGTDASSKRIPFDLISGYEDDFFYELMKGDGCFNVYKGYEKYSYSTVSKSLAYQVQFLAHSIDGNYAAGITKTPGGEGFILGRRVKLQPSYNVQINIAKDNSKESPWMVRAKNCIAARVRSVESVEYSGRVHNLHVQWDESYIVEGRAVHNCSFDRGISGSYYGEYLDRLRLKGQICPVEWEPGLLTYTAWDIGVNDATTIIFYQVVGDGTIIRIIDCYSNTGLGLDHYAKYIQDKPYRYGKHFAPHDIKVREWGGGAVTRYEKARQLGIDFTLVDQVPVRDGIENVWTHFSKFWIDEQRCRSLVDALENYRKEWDEIKQIYKDKPLHNWASNYADSVRYMCLSIHKTKKGLSSEEFERKKAQALYGGKQDLPRFFSDDPRFNNYR